MRGEGGALLPSDEMGYVIAGHVDGSVGLGQPIVAGEGILPPEVSYPRTEIVGNVAPRHVDRIGEFFGAAGMQVLNGAAGSFQFSWGVQLPKFRSILDTVPGDEHTFLREDIGAGIPNDADRLL